jgi:DNA-directed RNA polymerase alpha subunit
MSKITYPEFHKALEIVRKYTYQVNKENIAFKKELELKYFKKEELDPVFLTATKDSEIAEFFLFFSFRVLCVFHFYEIKKIGDLANYSERDIKKLRNVGRKTIDFIKELCIHANVKMLP